MTKNHNYYLDLAFQIAESNIGKTKINPSVGSVVVKNNTVISSGVTSINGRPHSEFNALKKLKNCAGASLYTTLEPCTHFGKTPPCVNIILKKKIKSVYYSFEDPDLRTFNKAKKILNLNGVKCKKFRSKKYHKFYKSYFLNKKLSIPFVTAKIAISKDYFTSSKKNKWITNYFSRKISHLLRNKHDCVISTSRSINVDDSLLNCRIEGLNNSKPDLFILDQNLKLKKKLSLNKLLKKRKTYLITNKDNIKKAVYYKKKGYKILLTDDLSIKNNFYLFLKKIYAMGYSKILIETGLTFLNNLLKKRLINELYIFKSNNKLGKNGFNNDTVKFLRKISPKILTINLNGDKLLKKEF